MKSLKDECVANVLKNKSACSSSSVKKVSKILLKSKVNNFFVRTNFLWKKCNINISSLFSTFITRTSVFSVKVCRPCWCGLCRPPAVTAAVDMMRLESNSTASTSGGPGAAVGGGGGGGAVAVVGSPLSQSFSSDFMGNQLAACFSQLFEKCPTESGSLRLTSYVPLWFIIFLKY